MKTKHGAVFLAACLLVPLAAQGQSYSLPDGGSVEVDIGADGGGSVSVTAPSVGIDFSVSFGGAGGSDPGSISAGGGGSGGVTSPSRARALAIPGLSEGPTAGKSGSSEQTSRSLASRSGGSGRAAQGLGGEWVSGVTGPGYNVPGFQAGPVGSYGVDAPPGPTISSTGSYTVSGPDSPTPPDDASYAINAPTASPDAQGAGAAPGGFNPITADQGTPSAGSVLLELVRRLPRPRPQPGRRHRRALPRRLSGATAMPFLHPQARRSLAPASRPARRIRRPRPRLSRRRRPRRSS